MSHGSIENGISGNYQFDIGATLSEAWQKTAGVKLTFFLAALVYMGVTLGASFLLGLVFGVTGGDSQSSVSAIVQQVILTALTLPLGMGLFMLGLKRSVDQSLAVPELFNYYGKTVQLVLTMILMYIMLIIGFLLLILPGIYLAIAYYFALPLVVEKNLGPWQALETSRKAITKRWFGMFGFVLLLTLIIIISAIPLGIGLIWTLPLALISMGILYRNMFGVEGVAPTST